MAAKFGTSGLRGLIEELVDGTAARHAGAFAAHLIGTGRSAPGDPLFVARDLRNSSPLIARHCMAAIAANGLVAVDCGEVPTPALALHAMAHRAGALMVTGSHIPDDRNGVKFYRPDGEIDKSDELRIADGAAGEQAFAVAEQALAIAEQALAVPTFDQPRNLSAEVLARFTQRYHGMLATSALAGLRIGVYEHSTVAREVLVEVLEAAGATVVRLGRSEHFIPVDTEAVTDDVQAQIRQWTTAHGLDALASADGDGDRPLLADDTGACLRGDLLGLMTARLLQADAVATPITSNSGLETHLNARVWRTRVGSPFVITAMAEAEAAGARQIIGFEANGGVLTGSPFQLGAATLAALPTRDSLLPILATLAAARAAGLSLSRLAASLSLPVAASGLIRGVQTATSQALIARLTADAEQRAAFCQPFGQIVAVDLTDGLRIHLAGTTMIHLRPSGNAPEMRLYVEAPDAAQSAALVERGIAQVRAWTA